MVRRVAVKSIWPMRGDKAQSSICPSIPIELRCNMGNQAVKTAFPDCSFEPIRKPLRAWLDIGDRIGMIGAPVRHFCGQSRPSPA